jgi:hypothetical protein
MFEKIIIIAYGKVGVYEEDVRVFIPTVGFIQIIGNMVVFQQCCVGPMAGRTGNICNTLYCSIPVGKEKIIYLLILPEIFPVIREITTNRIEIDWVFSYSDGK